MEVGTLQVRGRKFKQKTTRAGFISIMVVYLALELTKGVL